MSYNLYCKVYAEDVALISCLRLVPTALCVSVFSGMKKQDIWFFKAKELL